MIDVIVPAYNCRETLDRTLGSLTAQTNRNFRITIVDDCSSEDIRSIADRYRDILRINYIRNQKNLGCGMSRQTGIDHSSGEYLTFLDSDDVFLPYTIDVFEKNTREFPQTSVFSSYFYSTDSKGNIRLMKNAWTWCHGRLYQRKFLEKYGIRNCPDVKYCDDSFFNSIVDELNPEPMKMIALPMMMWLHNDRSVTRQESYREDCTSDFIYGMRKSVEYISQYKPVQEMDFVPGTLKHLALSVGKQQGAFSDEEKERVRAELRILEKCVSAAIPPEDFRKMFGGGYE